MLNVLVVLYLFVIILNPAIKLSNGADINKNSTSVASTWQPILQTYHWLPVLRNLTPAPLLSTTPSVSTLAIRQSANLKNNLTNGVKQKYRDFINSQTYLNYANNDNDKINTRNNGKPHLKTSRIRGASLSTETYLLTAQPSLFPALQSIQNIKLKTRDFQTNVKSGSNSNNISSRGEEKNQFNSSHQQQFYLLNNVKTVYPEIQIAKEAQEKQQKPPLLSLHNGNNKRNLISSSQFNLHHLTDMDQRQQLRAPSLAASYWLYLQQPQLKAKPITSLISKIDNNKNITTANTSSTTNINMKINRIQNGYETQKKNEENLRNSTNRVPPKNINSLSANKNLVESESKNVKRHQNQQHNHYHYYTILHNNGGVKSAVTSSVSEENLPTATDGATAVAATDDEKNFNVKLLLLRTYFNKAQEVFENITDIILHDKDNNSAGRSSEDDDDYDNKDDDDTYSNEVTTTDDNDLQLLNSSSHQVVKDTSVIMAAATMTTMEDMDSLSLKNMLLLSSPSIAEVQGRVQGIHNNGSIKYSFLHDTRKRPNVAAFVTSSINDRQARGQLWNLSTKTQPATQPLKTSTSQISSANSSGRKMKIFKRKLRKLLLPLVLAYKLKFMALIPLLIGGLTLLVGTTGLAGFFFALFMAVMSLKSDSRNEILVKKY